MKRHAASFLGIALAATIAVACSDDERRPGSGSSVDGGTSTKTQVDLEGEVTASRTLESTNDYLLKGIVFVRSGATLTIRKGTTIKGDNATKGILVIQPGAKILAEGTAEEPIVFTSQATGDGRKAGDWGGVIILGRATNNNPGNVGAVEGLTNGGQYGGTDDEDDSGVLKYVRLEYGGIELSPNNEVNGLTLAGVGRGTVIDYVQVRHALDDCFEFFGGTVNAKHLACQYNQDDGIDWDNGWRGKVQYAVVQQDPNSADETNGFEGDNDATATMNVPLSEPTLANVTLCGKNKEVPKAQFGMLLRRNTKAHVFNTMVLGFESSLDIRDPGTADHVAGGGIEIKNSVFFGATGAGVVDALAYAEPATGTAPDKDNDGNFDEVAFLKTAESNNSTANPNVAGCFNPSAPQFAPQVTLTAPAPPSDPFFDATATYVGAFKDAADDWATKGRWAVWADR